MTDEDIWNSYFYPGTDILKNKLNIKDKNELKKAEYSLVAKKNTLLILDRTKPDTFDINHLKYIHKYLFEDIYPFAGELRDVEMGKGFMFGFTKVELIETSLHEILDNIDEEVIKYSSSKMFYSENLAKLYKRLIQIHPFREGNGRKIREFLREYVESRNKYFDVDYYLDFNLSEEDLNVLEHVPKEEKYGNLTMVFMNILKSKEKTNIKKF